LGPKNTGSTDEMKSENLTGKNLPLR
jgi:hypothetical protein